MNNIEPIVNNKLCTQCGTCIAVCPVDAIGLDHHTTRGLLPRIDKACCTRCGKCVTVCPGKALKMNDLQKDVFGKIPADPLFGHVLNVFSGHSTDQSVRYNGASGGVVSTILIELLKNKQINGALVVRMSHTHPLQPEIFIARNKEEIISAQQSKYLPVPINIGLKEILSDRGGKYAMVGLPCHLHGLRLIEKIFPCLRAQIILRIGLFCGFNPTMNSTKFLLRRAGVKHFEDVYEIKYRDGDWPCGFRAVMKDGSDRFLYPIEHFLFSHYIFERHRCAMCRDHLCELADLSIGDEWRIDIKSSVGGWSFIVVRTPAGEKVLNRLVDQKKMYIEPSSSEVIYSGQRSSINFKKKGSFAFARIKRLLGKHVPDYLVDEKFKPGVKHYIGAGLIYTVTLFFGFAPFRVLFIGMPTWFFTKFRWLIIKLFQD